MAGIGDIVDNMVKEIPGVMAAIFIDKDGIPLATAGELNFDSYDLGAIGAEPGIMPDFGRGPGPVLD